MSIITIILFFLYLWGLGYTATYWLKKPESCWERQGLYLAMGLGVFPFLVIVLNFLHIILDWRIILGLSLVFPLGVLANKLRKKEFSFPHSFPKIGFAVTKSTLFFLGAVLIVLISLYIYASGAFQYPYLEDEDPWGHAVGAKYVALEKNAYDPIVPGRVDPVLSYIDPYPPAYDVLIGILHQTSADLNWTIKFFNALLISLGFLFFYLFAAQFMGNKGNTGSKAKALLATFFLASVPAYLSHFIWAHGLAITLFFPLMYALLMISEDKKWWFLAAVIMASVWVSQNFEQPIKITMLAVAFIIVASIASRKFLKYESIAVGSGIALSLVWWGVMIQRHTLKGFVRYFTGDKVFVEETVNAISSAAPTFSQKLLALYTKLTFGGGSGTRAYSFEDFFFAKGQNAINNPIGFGIVISLLVLIGVVYLLWRHKSSLVEEKNTSLCVALFWLILTFWMVNGATFLMSIARGPFRSWMLLAIPMALVAVEGVHFLQMLSKSKIVKAAIVIAVLLGVFFTSFQAKYELNTAIWPTSGSFGNQQEIMEYSSWFASLPIDSRIFLYSPRTKVPIGFGHYSCAWCLDEGAFRERILYKDAAQLHTFLKSKSYEYLVLNQRMEQKYFKSTFGEENSTALLPLRYKDILESGLFIPTQQGQTFLVLKVGS